MSEAISDKPTILVVDDTPQNVELLDELLRPYYRVKVALNGERALAAVARQAPDLILLDVMMPGMDGYEVCRRLKADPVTRHIPVIFITARNEVEDEQLGFDLGAVDYVTKPISPPILLARARNHLALQSQRRALQQEVQQRTAELAQTNAALTNEVNARQRAMEHAEYLFNYDQATSLPNRRQFTERLERAVERARQDHTPLAVIGFSLDRFSVIKTTLGGAVGDQVLVQAGQRLQGCCRSTDLLARIGGEEFALLLQVDGVDEAALEADADKLAGRAVGALAEPFELASGRANVTASAAYTLFPAEGDSASELVRRVESTLEHLKLQGGNRYRRYDGKVDSGAVASFAMETRIREALRLGQLLPYYQPKVQANTGRIVGAEALIRWPLPSGGFVSPGEFIPVAERTGLIGLVDEFILDRCCQQLADWDREMGGLGEFRLAVNLSSAAFQGPNLATNLQAVLARTGAKPEHLELEITEYALITDISEAVEKLKAVRDMGISVALDDFGTGYSSLAYLRRLPMDVLKVDQSFVRDIEKDKNAAAIASAIVHMGRSLDLKLVAEGVETAAQHAFLANHGCDYIQGWLFSPAVPVARMSELMKQQVLKPILPRA